MASALLKSYPNEATQADVNLGLPKLVNYAPKPIAMKGEIRQLSVKSNQGATVSPSSKMNFEIPNSMGSLVPGSVFLRFTLNGIKGTNGFAANSTLNIGGSGIIDALTVSQGPCIYDTITHYNRLYGQLLSAAAPSDYVGQDGAVLERIGYVYVTGAADTAQKNIECIIPLVFSLNMAQTAFPLWLTSTALSIEITTAMASVCFNCVSSADLVVSISNPTLYYSIIVPDESYKSLVINTLSQGNLLKYDCKTFSCTQYAADTSTDYSVHVPINSSSLLAAFWGRVLSSTADGVTAFTYFLNDTDPSTYAYRLYVDNVLTPSYIVDSSRLAYAEAQRCFGKIFDVSSTGRGTDTTYSTTHFINGINLQRYPSDNSVIMGGTPVKGNITLELSGNSAASRLYFCVCREFIIAIDGVGNAICMN